MRSFVAVEAAADVREKLARMQEELKRTGAGIRWVKPENIHVTIKFLGDAPVEPLRADLRAIARKHAPFDLEINGLGTFPPKGPPRVVWAGCESDALTALAADVEACAERIGIPREKRGFTGHLTLGRARSRGPRPTLTLPDHPSFGTQRVSSFVLMESDLTPKGAVYSPIETYGLSE